MAAVIDVLWMHKQTGDFAMTRQQTPHIVRRADGSIDTDHYMRIGRQHRADQAATLAKATLRDTHKTRRRLRVWWRAAKEIGAARGDGRRALS